MYNSRSANVLDVWNSSQQLQGSQQFQPTRVKQGQVLQHHCKTKLFTGPDYWVGTIFSKNPVLLSDFYWV